MNKNRSEKPIKSEELEEEVKRERAARGTQEIPDNRKSGSDPGSDLREGEERAVSQALTRFPPG
ncbi:hypothetical protein KY084_05570 [Stakelama sp. CBK3Z-3]|uniref:Uncharacterized protein n=1 Tax=Stakelama flava TaxID=2860338 RepID=A0ABS6XJG8_9SPHN|nr:hypothetical protein [Stakelama flava]MBW4330340.1 hypothetical protein [Stakelama flava]